jgi:hypothetical protein
MRLHKYNQFLGDKSINEDVNKSKKFLKERHLLRKAAEEMGLITGELEQQLKHDEIRSVTLNDFTPEQGKELKYKMRGMKISEEEIHQIERDPEFLKLREILKDNIGYLYNFTYMYYVEMVTLEEIQSMYNRLLEYKDLLNQLPKKFNVAFIDTKINNNSEILVDGLDKLEDYRKVKKVIDKLTSELKKDYKKAAEGQKETFSSIATAFNEMGKRDDGTIDEEKRDGLWKSFFGEVRVIEGTKRYVGQLRRYKTIGEFNRAAENFLKASENSDILAFYDKINDCNEKFGFAGADIVFDENGILIIEVKSFPANQMLNGHTRHCIKDYNSQWESYVSNHNNKQYYIYNFNIPQHDNMSVVGITIEPGQRVRAAHAKNDSSVGSSFKRTMDNWQREYGIEENLWAQLKPMTQEEVDRRERAKVAERQIVNKGLSIEDIIRYVKEDGANINKNNGVCLQNAVDEDDYEKVKVILQLGASPNLKKGADAPISKAKNLEMIKLLVSNGSDITGDVFNNILHDMDALEYCLKAGLDPNFNNFLPFRRVCKGNWKTKDDIGESYLGAFKLLVKYGAKLSDERGRNMIIKWSAEYSRLDILDWLDEQGLSQKFSVKDWEEAVTWISHSRKINTEIKTRVVAYLENVISSKE